jgi:hypothetical protein
MWEAGSPHIKADVVLNVFLIYLQDLLGAIRLTHELIIQPSPSSLALRWIRDSANSYNSYTMPISRYVQKASRPKTTSSHPTTLDKYHWQEHRSERQVVYPNEHTPEIRS